MRLLNELRDLMEGLDEWSPTEKLNAYSKWITSKVTKPELLSYYGVDGFNPGNVFANLNGKKVQIRSAGDFTQAKSYIHRELEPGIAHHIALKVGDSSTQGMGIGKTLFKQALDLYKKLGIKKIDLLATEIGKYAWVKYGFIPETDEFLKVVRERLRAYLGRLPLTQDIDTANLYELAILELPIDEDTIEALLSLTDEDGKLLVGSRLKDRPWTKIKDNKKWYVTDETFLIGKYVILNETGTLPWKGYLNI